MIRSPLRRSPLWTRSGGARSPACGAPAPQPGRTVLLGSSVWLFWLVVFGISWRVLTYFRGVEEIGPLLAASCWG
jgi:hypothetical protein